jgi:pyroglutamyl-peptidase
MESSNTDKSPFMEQECQRHRIYRQISFILTGFGNFGGITDNPTSHLVKLVDIENEDRVTILSRQTVEVSTRGCLNFIEEIKNKLMFEHRTDNENLFIVVNFGVNGGSSDICLENSSYNKAHFSIPDAQNNQPRLEKICNEMDLDQEVKCKIDLNEVLNKLDEETRKYIKISSDPGRYICNYMYFNCSREFQRSDAVNLFVHVPLFTTMSCEMQVNSTNKLLSQIARFYLDEA